MAFRLGNRQSPAMRFRFGDYASKKSQNLFRKIVANILAA
jgi:hypothetical protein